MVGVRWWFAVAPRGSEQATSQAVIDERPTDRASVRPALPAPHSLPTLCGKTIELVAPLRGLRTRRLLSRPLEGDVVVEHSMWIDRHLAGLRDVKLHKRDL